MRLILALAALLYVGALGRDQFDAWVDRTDLPVLVQDTSVETRGHDGTLMRAYTVEDGLWRLDVSLDQVDAGYIDMLLAFEDRHFWTHSGVDPRAAMRAVGQALRQGRVVSGGSTLTMQVARLLERSDTGAWSGKMRQVRVALALELMNKSMATSYLKHLSRCQHLLQLSSRYDCTILYVVAVKCDFA